MTIAIGVRGVSSLTLLLAPASRGVATEQPGAAAALRGDGGMAAEDEGGKRLPQLSLPGGPGPGGEAGPGEPLPAEPGQRAGLLRQPLQLQPD